MNLFKNFLLIIISTVIATSCFREKAQEKKDKAKQELINYVNELKSQGENVLYDVDNNIYYVVYNANAGTSINAENLIEFTGEIQLLDGYVVTTTSKEKAKELDLYDTNYIYGTQRIIVGYHSILGFNIGLTLLNEGDSAKLIIPEYLAYGSSGSTRVPEYSNLVINCKIHKTTNQPHNYETGLLKDYITNDTNNVSLGDTTEHGIYYIELIEGTGDTLVNNERIIFSYDCYLLDGRSVSASSDAEIFLGDYKNDIHPLGLHEGIAKMKVGGNAKIVVPYYSAFGVYSGFRPYSTLVYNVEVKDAYGL